MFSAGDTVSYGTQGICRIAGTTEMEIGRSQVPTYILNRIKK